MSNAANRRQLVQNDIEEFDCCLTFDVNEYCIETWPSLTFKNRQSTWATLQNDEEFDWSTVENQIDVFVQSEFSVSADTKSETDDEAETSVDTLNSALYDYIVEYWEGLEDEDLDELTEFLITTIDEAVDAYFDDDETEDTTNDENESND